MSDDGIRFQAKCILCLDDFTEPRRLPCADTHVFCAKCIHQYTRWNAENGQFKCPAKNPDCAAWYPVPENGLDGIRKQLTLVEDLEVLTHPDTSQEHEPGERGKIVCMEDGHTTEDAVIYCKDHNKLVCLLCVTCAHKNCDLSQVTDEVEKQKVKVKELLEEIRKYNKDLRKHIDDTRKAFELSDGDLLDMEKKVETSFQDLQSAINQMKSGVLRKIEVIKKDRKKAEVTTQHREIMENVDQIESRCSRVTEETDLFRLMDKALKIQEKWIAMSKEKIPTFSWRYSCEELQKQPDNLIGEVSRQTNINNVQSKMSLGDRMSAVMEINCPGGSREITGIVDVGVAVLAARYFKCYIPVYSSENGKRIQDVPVPGLQHPWGGLVCLSQEGQAHVELVSDTDSCCLHFLMLSRQWKITKHEKIDLGYRPWGITAYKEGSSQEGVVHVDLLVVTDCDNKKVHMYNRR